VSQPRSDRRDVAVIDLDGDAATPVAGRKSVSRSRQPSSGKPVFSGIRAGTIVTTSIAFGARR
jgi:hypothetical protein